MARRKKGGSEDIPVPASLPKPPEEPSAAAGPPTQPQKGKASVRSVERSRALEAIADVSYPFLYDLRYPMAYLHMWYECYQSILKYIGAVAAGIMTLTIGFLFEHLLSPAGEVLIDSSAARYLQVSFILFGTTLATVVLARIFTYNWLKIGLTRTVRAADLFMDEVVKREFGSYDLLSIGMATWGRLSLWFGLVAGLQLCFAVGLYILAAWHALERIF